MKKLMILGASILQIPAILEAKKMGLYVIAVDMNPNAEGFSYADKKIVVSTTDTEKVLEEAKKNKIDGIITIASDRPMTTVAKVAKELNLIGINESAAINATNKSKMRDVLKKNNVPIPMYFSVSNYDCYIKAINKIRENNYRCIVKPADNSGSRGIRLIDNYESDNLRRIYDYCMHNSISGNIVVEEYMEGPEVSVETISKNGICNVIQVTDKLTTGAPYFVEMGHSQPSQLDHSIVEKIKKVAIEANRAIGIIDGPSHTEIKITKDGPKIVEIGARLGGDNITTHLVPYSTGVNMVEACIKLSIGEDINLEKNLNLAAAIRYIEYNKGKIKFIHGLNEAKNMSGIKDVTLVRKVNENLNDIKCSGDRAGFVISQASNPKDAISIAERAIRTIKFEFFFEER
ncbi:ATP-grasp domain-containing protein [Anaerococcus kampingiae]|uniref:ATP-grasp domain-containing protein n=1 Tax=Anaerococcus kampingae TaxID=3115614 RepID=A0ABW9MD08_9FIRM